jgi:hypothetical protein
MTAMFRKASLPSRRRIIAGLPAWLALAAAAHAQTAGSEAPPTRVTSDSPEFCALLSDMLRQNVRALPFGPVPDEVRMLGREGRRMCREGHIRPGILRIRRALLILRGQNLQLR